MCVCVCVLFLYSGPIVSVQPKVAASVSSKALRRLGKVDQYVVTDNNILPMLLHGIFPVKETTFIFQGFLSP